MKFETIQSIAIASKGQVKASTRSELMDACKLLSVKGYSRLKQADLVELVWENSQPMRDTIKQLQTQTEAEKMEAVKKRKQEQRGTQTSDNLINKTFINKIFIKADNAKAAGSILFKLCLKFYSEITVAKDLTAKLKLVLPETSLSDVEQVDFLAGWREGVREINYVEKLAGQIKNQQHAVEKSIKINTIEVLKWAETHLSSENRYELGLALAITSGRRLVEIFGTAEYSLGEVGISIVGLAKTNEKNSTCEFIPLCDRKLWLESLDRLTRGYTTKQVSKGIASKFSKKFPSTLKDLGILKFKDTRDVYAAIAYKTFNEFCDANPFTRAVMGHQSEDATAYYKKVDCQPLESLRDEFEAYTQLIHL